MRTLPEYLVVWNRRHLREMFFCLARGFWLLFLAYGFTYLALRPLLGLFLESAFMAKWLVLALVLVCTGIAWRDFPGWREYVPLLGDRSLAREKLEALLGSRSGGAYGFGFRRPRPALYLLFFVEGPALILEGLSHWWRRVSLRSALVEEADQLLATLGRAKMEDMDPRSLLLLFRLNLIWPEYSTLQNELTLKPTIHAQDLVVLSP